MARSKYPRPISGKLLTGILQKPIDKIPPLAIGLVVHGEPEATRQVVYKIADDHEALQVTERLSALAAHYKVNLLRQQWAIELLLAVCKDFIVGFNYSTEIGSAPTRAGRKKGKTNFPQFEFWQQVTLLQTTKGMELEEACRHLSRQREKAWSNHTVGALAKRFSRYESGLRSVGEKSKSDAVWQEIIKVVEAANKRISTD